MGWSHHKAPYKGGQPKRVWVPKLSGESAVKEPGEVNCVEPLESLLSSPRPGSKAGLAGFPNAAEWAKVHCSHPRGQSMFPLPQPKRPVKPGSKSARLRNRFSKRLQVWRVAAALVATVNGLDSGGSPCKSKRADQTLVHHRFSTDTNIAGAQQLTLANFLTEAAAFVRCRRLSSSRVTGGLSQKACPTSLLLKHASSEGGYVRLKTEHVNQVPLIAEAIDEPKTNHHVNMLDALPPDDSFFYSREQHCLELAGKSSVILEELSAQYGFIGGELEQFVAYFERKDLPQMMWNWSLWSECRTVAGFAVVPKKDPSKQKKSSRALLLDAFSLRMADHNMPYLIYFVTIRMTTR